MTLRTNPTLPVVAIERESYCFATTGISQLLSSRTLANRLFSSFNSVPAFQLCHIQRRVGGADQLVPIGGVGGKVGYTHADGDRTRNTGELVVLHHAAQFVCDSRRAVG